MLFTSPQFLVFFIAVCSLSAILRNGSRKWLLLLTSFVFIASFNVLTLITAMFFSGFTFLIARLLAKQSGAGLFYFAVAINGLAIILFNYILASGSSLIVSLAAIDFSPSSILLFIGLSFYNLQHIAYLVDVQKNRIPPCKDFFDFLLFSCYFPKFITGPLMLYQQLEPQINEPFPDKPVLWQGFNRILLGFFKKMVIADRLAPSVNSIFDYNDHLPGITVLAGGLLFTLQLYFDFSGYCDMAIGFSKMLGIELPENFDFPLRATSITDFWRKWHRSLIGFFTSYIFYPVSFRFRRQKKQAAAIAVFLTFFVSAIWHGIGITFMLWALCHMIYLIIELYFRRTGENKKGLFTGILLVILVLLLVTFSNIFFRSQNIQVCRQLISGLFSGEFFPENLLVDFVAPIAVGGQQGDHFNLMITALFTLLILVFERRIFALSGSQGFRPLWSLMLLVAIFMFGVFNNGQRFIYMQF